MPTRRVPKEGSAAKQNGGTFNDPAARETLKQFRLLLGTIKKHYRDVEASCGLGGAQLWALSEIAAEPDLTVRDVAERLLIHQSTASNLIDRIERMGMVRKRRSEQDRRQVLLEVTARGTKALAKAPSPAIGVLQDALQRLSPETLSGLGQHMTQLTSMLQIRHPSAVATPLSEL